jgi:hypothetical protein
MAPEPTYDAIADWFEQEFLAAQRYRTDGGAAIRQASDAPAQFGARHLPGGRLRHRRACRRRPRAQPDLGGHGPMALSMGATAHGAAHWDVITRDNAGSAVVSPVPGCRRDLNRPVRARGQAVLPTGHTLARQAAWVWGNGETTRPAHQDGHPRRGGARVRWCAQAGTARRSGSPAVATSVTSPTWATWSSTWSGSADRRWS